MLNQIEVLLRVAGLLEEMRTPYFVAGSIDTLFKVDIYVPKDDEFGRQQFQGVRRETLLPGGAGGACVSAPEDTIPAKLRWHRRGGGASERQLSDVLGVLKVQRERLDLEYLR